MLEDFNRDYEELKRRVEVLESKQSEMDDYKDLPPVLTASDIKDFLKVGTTKAYEILKKIGIEIGGVKRCTKTRFIQLCEGREVL